MLSKRLELQEFVLPEKFNESPLQPYRSRNTSSCASQTSSSFSGLRSPSFCSTCSPSDYSDAEEEDPASKWPWIEHIQENGDLLFIKSYSETNTMIIQKNTTKEQIENIINNERKDKRFQEKIKDVIKKSRSFSKKDIISNDNHRDKPHHHHPHKNNIDHNNMQNYKTAHIETKLSDTVNIVCKNIALQLNDKIKEDFISLENVLGVISGLDFDPVLDDFDYDILMSNYNGLKHNPNSIVVQGILPNSPIGRTDTVLIGDIILAINGTEVNHLNVVDILSSINGEAEIIITVERLIQNVQNTNQSRLCNIVTNTYTNHIEQVFEAYEEICGVFLLTFQSSEDEPDSDIVFWYPQSKCSQKLKNLRGVFLTLSDIMTSVTQTSVHSSSLIVDDQMINVCYDKIGDDVFLVASPNSKCSISQLSEYTKDILNLFCVVYGTTTRAFSKDNLPITKHLISIFMEEVVSHSCRMFGIRQLQLPVELYVDVSNVLSVAEAADYGECMDDFFPHRRLYGTIGTCLFYQDMLVCNHLSDEYLKEIVLFCKYHWLFEMSRKEKLKQLVVWKEIYLCSTTTSQMNTDYHEPTGVRWFLLVVGQGKSLLCTLMEAGGVASVPDGNPGPHPYYVDTAVSILTFLNETMDLETLCQSKLNGGSTPSVVKPIEVLNPKVSQSPRALELVRRRIPTQITDQYNTQLRNSINAGGHYRQTSFDSSLDGSDSLFTLRRGSHASTVSGNSTIMLNDSVSFRSDISTTNVVSTKLTAGVNNTLFCFLTVKPYQGILLSSNIPPGDDSLTQRICDNFHKACEQIHKQFGMKQCDMQQVEHGILFRLQSTKGAEIKKGQPNIKYWVVGRLVRTGKQKEEIYVCFQDGVPQNVVEMAFKMRYGCYY